MGRAGEWSTLAEEAECFRAIRGVGRGRRLCTSLGFIEEVLGFRRTAAVAAH